MINNGNNNEIIYNGWRYVQGADKYNEDNWGLDIFNDDNELVCSLLHKSFEDFESIEDMAKYVNDYINICIY